MHHTASPAQGPTDRSRRAVVTAFLVLCFAVVGETSVVAAGRDRLPPGLVRQVENLRTQIGRTYRLNHYQRDRQMAQVERVLQLWNSSTRESRDDELLDAWLNGAMHRSVPIRRLPLPPVPRFTGRSVPRRDTSTWPLPTARVIRHARQPSPRFQVFPTILGYASVADTDTAVLGTNSVPSPHQPLPSYHQNVLSSWAPNRPPRRRFVLASAAVVKSIDGLVPEESVPVSHVAEEFVAAPPLPTDSIPAAALTSSTERAATDFAVGRVNLAEYRARAAGYRRGLRRIEAQLVSGEAQTSRELMELAQELDALAVQRTLLGFYSNLLGSGGPRDLPDRLPHPGTVRKLLRKAAETRRDALRKPGVLPTLQDRQRELSILSAIEQRLGQE